VECGIQSARIDTVCHASNDFSASHLGHNNAAPVSVRTYRSPVKYPCDAGSCEPACLPRSSRLPVSRRPAGARCAPISSVDKGHHEYLGRHAVDVSKGADQASSAPLPTRPGRTFRAFQSVVDPANQVAVARSRTNKKREYAAGSVVPLRRCGRAGAGIDVIGLGACEAGLVVSAALELQ